MGQDAEKSYFCTLMSVKGYKVKAMKQALTLQERLALFDPEKHSGEIMEAENIGLEKL